jgi:hypothetical protein
MTKILPPLYPINKLASIVVNSKGEHWEKNNIVLHMLESIYPFPMRPVPFNAKNLIGKKAGRKTIIGYYGSAQFKLNGYKKKANNSGSRWVTRCDCGIYGLTTTKNFNKSFGNKRSRNMCTTCTEIENLKIDKERSNKIRCILKKKHNEKKNQFYVKLENILTICLIVTNDYLFFPFILKMHPLPAKSIKIGNTYI